MPLEESFEIQSLSPFLVFSLRFLLATGDVPQHPTLATRPVACCQPLHHEGRVPLEF